jgi:hypothetical protein
MIINAYSSSFKVPISFLDFKETKIFEADFGKIRKYQI